MSQIQPITALRFKNLILAVAEYLGTAEFETDPEGYTTGAAKVPEDAHALDVAKRMVNKGWHRFVSESLDPSTKAKHTWTFLNQYTELTLSATADDRHVDGDIGRYFMPWYFNGIAMREWEFNSESYSHKIIVVSDASVIERQSVTQDTSGPPTHCSFRRLAPRSKPANEERLWECVFWPKPGETLTINTTVRAYPTGLQDLDDFHFAGAEHDETIEQACLAAAEINRHEEAGVQNDLYVRLLANSMALDRSTAPRSLGLNLDSGNQSRLDRHFGYSGVDSYNGTTIDDAT